jgi:hypothetical protein
MIERHYTCRLLSDIIISAGTATEGASASLDYIPGSNFMGIAAGSYDSFGSDTAYEIFHSGHVRFGDAHLAVDGKRSLKMPCSWYYPKGSANLGECYVHHAISPEKRQIMREKGPQLKQVRAGFFIQDQNRFFKVSNPHQFSIKSAYDMDKRKSKDEQMFGYDALIRGSRWIFTIYGHDQDLLEKINKTITGVRHVGRSKTAQYGRVEIKEMLSFSSKTSSFENGKDNRLILYFESPAAFLDNSGNWTVQPDISDFGLDSGQIDWSGSQVRHRSFAPWNGKRKGRDQDRMFIDKGSVVLIRDYDPGLDLEAWSKEISRGIGLFRTEGFGAVIINPQFLNVEQDSPLQILEREINHESMALQKKDESDENTIQWLNSRKQDLDNNYRIMNQVSDFLEKYGNRFNKGISSSQWGAVRERAEREPDYERLMDSLFDSSNGFLRHGKSEKTWRRHYQILEHKMKQLHQDLPPGSARLFLIKTATEIHRIKGGINDGN